MTTPKDIRGFTPKWREMFQWFEANPGETLEIACETVQKAHSLRLEFYRARGLMWKDEGCRILFPNMRAWEASIDPESSKVTFRHKNSTPIALLLEKALDDKKAEKPK